MLGNKQGKKNAKKTVLSIRESCFVHEVEIILGSP